MESGTAYSARKPAVESKLRKIMVVDDDAFILETVKYRLQKERYHVVTASDSFEAMGHLKKEQPDLILLDIMLPGLSGLELLNIIRYQHLFNTPVIFISSLDNTNFIDSALNLGGSDYLTKPLNYSLMLEKIRQFLPEA